MPSVTFSDYASTSWGTLWSDVEIDYTETYNVATNVTRVSISGVYFRTRGDTNFGTQVIRGRVKINGETVCSFSPGSSTATQINVTGSYSKLDNGSGSFYADVAHAADGTGSFTIAVDEAEDASISSVFGFWYRAPKLRMAHVDSAAAGRLGRLFTFEDMMGVPRSAQ